MVRPIVLAFVLVALGCNKEKGADCQKLLQVAGPQHASLREAFGRSDQQPSDLEAQAVAFEKGAADLEALDVKDESVKAIATEYAGVLKQAAQVRRDMAASAGALDPAAAAKAQAGATSLIVEETRVKAKIDTTCR
ncbi:MAG: hypothetical protein HYV09_00235 [Deltaproteobacteria bacterium]|nr:hypothetical protein [Deltaproteobacteria bacterium]